VPEITYRELFDSSGAPASRWTVDYLDNTGTSLGSMDLRQMGPTHLYIENVGVRPESRRQGIASALFKRVVNENPHISIYSAMAETPEGRVLLESLARNFPGLITFTPTPEAMGTPENLGDTFNSFL
jgi:predicted GNAT family acetyltransferase